MDPVRPPAAEKYVWLYGLEGFHHFVSWTRCPDWVDERHAEKLRCKALRSKMVFGAFDNVMQGYINIENERRHFPATSSLTWKILERSEEHGGGTRMLLYNHKRSIFLHLVYVKESQEHAYLRPPLQNIG